MAVMQSKGSEVVAQKAANCVLEEGKKKKSTTDSKSLATKVSVVVLGAGGDHKVAAAVAVAIMNNDGGDGNGSERGSRKDRGSGRKNTSKGGKRSNRSGFSLSNSSSSDEGIDKYKSKTSSIANNHRSSTKDIPIDDDWLQPGPSQDSLENKNSSGMSTLTDNKTLPSETTSMKSTRRKLDQKEAEIEERNKALTDAAKLNEEREHAIQDRMAALEAAAAAEDRKEKQFAVERKAAAKRAARERAEKSARATVERQRKEKYVAEEAMHLELHKKEEEIERRNRVLEERLKALQREEQELSDRHKAAQAQALAPSSSFHSKLQNMKKSFSNNERSNSLIDLESITSSMASKRRHLEEKEAIIARQNQALEEAARLNMQREQDIRQRMMDLERATSQAASEKKQQALKEREDAKRRELQLKEEEIARQNRELEEAARINLEKEREITERMAALDAATAALLERANNVQAEIDRRSQCSGNRSGTVASSTLGRVEEEREYSSKHAGSDQRGEISVATPNGCDSYGKFGQHVVQNAQHDEIQGGNGLQNAPQSPSLLQQSKSKGVFEQLTGKLYSILDIACDSAAWVPEPSTNGISQDDNPSRVSPQSTLPGIVEGEDGNGSYFSPQGASLREQEGGLYSYYHGGADIQNAQPQDGGGPSSSAYPEPPRFKSPTLSGLTDDKNINWDDQRTWRSLMSGHNEQGDIQKEDGTQEQSVKDFALKNAGENIMESGPNQLLNDALNRTMSLQGNVQPTNGGHPTSINDQVSQNKPSYGSPNQLLNEALNQAMTQQQQHQQQKNGGNNLAANHALNQALSQAMNQQQQQPGISHQPQKSSGPPSVLKQPTHGNYVVSKPTSLKSRMKVSFLSSFTKKSTADDNKNAVNTPGATAAGISLSLNNGSKPSLLRRTRSQLKSRQDGDKQSGIASNGNSKSSLMRMKSSPLRRRHSPSKSRQQDSNKDLGGPIKLQRAGSIQRPGSIMNNPKGKSNTAVPNGNNAAMAPGQTAPAQSNHLMLRESSKSKLSISAKNKSPGKQRQGTGSPNQNEKKGQLFSFSRKRSKLIEV